MYRILLLIKFWCIKTVFFTLLQATIHHENYLININKSVWHNFCKICNSLRISRALFNRKDVTSKEPLEVEKEYHRIVESNF